MFRSLFIFGRRLLRSPPPLPLVAFGLEFSFVAANCVMAAVSTLICAAISASTCVNGLLGLICATISATAHVNGLLWTFL